MNFVYTLSISDIEVQAHALEEFHQRYQSYFRTQTRDGSSHALEYLKGQLLCPSRRNMNKIATQISTHNEQALAHFISHSPWDDDALCATICQDAVALLNTGDEENALILDESGIAKQGKQSVGVARQYCGALGKVDNCQVGVYLAISNGTEATLIDKRLYLPQEWTDNSERCTHAGIPLDQQRFQTKTDLGYGMITNAKTRGVPFQFVSMDTFYGRDAAFLTQLHHDGIEYMADIPSDTRVYLEYPTVGVPSRTGRKGRRPSKERVLSGQPIRVDHLLTSDRLQWQSLKLRDIQRGELWVRCAVLRIHRIENELPCQQVDWLVIRQELDGSDVNYSFSNAPETTSLPVLACRQGRRYWVERALQDAKGLAGLDEYQVMGWRGWQHHMALVMLAMVFLLTLKRRLQPAAPMLTLQDAKEILEQTMPKKQLSHEEAVELIRKEHENRLRTRTCYLKQQKQWLLNQQIQI